MAIRTYTKTANANVTRAKLVRSNAPLACALTFSALLLLTLAETGHSYSPCVGRGHNGAISPAPWLGDDYGCWQYATSYGIMLNGIAPWTPWLAAHAAAFEAHLASVWLWWLSKLIHLANKGALFSDIEHSTRGAILKGVVRHGPLLVPSFVYLRASHRTVGSSNDRKQRAYRSSRWTAVSFLLWLLVGWAPFRVGMNREGFRGASSAMYAFPVFDPLMILAGTTITHRGMLRWAHRVLC